MREGATAALPIGAIADALERDGFVVLPDPVEPGLLAGLCARCHDEAPDRFHAAQIGRGGALHADRAIRGDVISWLDGADAVDHAWLAAMEALRLGLNEALCLGLFDYEAHYAVYGAGAGYARHSDVLRSGRPRILTTVLYLNEGWRPGDGGELQLFHPEEPLAFASVLPTRGRMIVFLSDRFPHEVLVSHTSRYSLAGWFRGRGS